HRLKQSKQHDLRRHIEDVLFARDVDVQLGDVPSDGRGELPCPDVMKSSLKENREHGAQNVGTAFGNQFGVVAFCWQERIKKDREVVEIVENGHGGRLSGLVC